MKAAIIIHTIAIIIAFFISFFIFSRAKGDKLHKLYGWIFVISMGIGAISSFWIQAKDWFSPIHILSIFTLYWLIRGVLSVRSRGESWKYKHIRNMASAFIGILIAGVGVLVRHYIDPGNAKLGFVASGIAALIVIPVMIHMVKKYK